MKKPDVYQLLIGMQFLLDGKNVKERMSVLPLFRELEMRPTFHFSLLVQFIPSSFGKLILKNFKKFKNEFRFVYHGFTRNLCDIRRPNRPTRRGSSFTLE